MEKCWTLNNYKIMKKIKNITSTIDHLEDWERKENEVLFFLLLFLGFSGVFLKENVDKKFV